MKNRIIETVREVAGGYEPAVVSSVAAAAFVLAAGLGIGVGDLPEKVNAVLVFVAFVAPLIAGTYARAKVQPLKRLVEGADGVYR